MHYDTQPALELVMVQCMNYVEAVQLYYKH